MYYRVENKYIVYEDQIAYIRERLKDVMERDVSGRDGSYLVRSLYFDDFCDSALYELESGIDERSKMRIRAYNAEDALIRLEEKSKRNGFTHKASVRILRDTVMRLIERPSLAEASAASACLLREEGYLFRKLYADMNTRLMHPVIIVEYEREAFVEKNGNVRITLDRNIGASQELNRFFDRDIYAVPVMETGAHVLEIKYDELLPDNIRKLIDIGSLQRSACSKYYYARQIIKEMETAYEFSGCN